MIDEAARGGRRPNLQDGKQPPKVLLVEDNRPLNEALTQHLALAGLKVVSTYDGFEAYERSRTEDFGVIVLDLGLPGLHGLELMQLLGGREARSRCPMIVLTGLDENACSRALLRGAYRVLRKPVRPEELTDLIHLLLAEGRTKEAS